MTNISARLTAFIESLGISKNAFAKEIGTSSALISKLTTQDTDFRIDFLDKIITRYPDFNPKWLLTGIGDMMLTNISETKKVRPQMTPEQLEDFKRNINQVRKTAKGYKNRLQSELSFEHPELLETLDNVIDFTTIIEQITDVIDQYFYIYDPEIEMTSPIKKSDINAPASYEEYKKLMIDEAKTLQPYSEHIENTINSLYTFLNAIKPLDTEDIIWKVKK